MTSCKDCIFSETVEDEGFLACQVKQHLVMPYSGVCDLFEQKDCVCPECTHMTMELNGVNEYTNNIQEEYINSTGCNCEECCKLDLFSDLERNYLVEDLKKYYLGVLETMAAIDEDGTPRDVLKQVLGLESVISLIKAYLLEQED
jgi:hypothetical protein